MFFSSALVKNVLKILSISIPYLLETVLCLLNGSIGTTLVTHWVSIFAQHYHIFSPCSFFLSFDHWVPFFFRGFPRNIGLPSESVSQSVYFAVFYAIPPPSILYHSQSPSTKWGELSSYTKRWTGSWVTIFSRDQRKQPSFS